MPLHRKWQREINEREQAARAEEHGPIVLSEFVRAVFDGAIGDHDLPFASQDDANGAVVRALVERGRRPLTVSETTKVGMEVAVQWNQRAAIEAEEQRRQRVEWIEDFQEGHVTPEALALDALDSVAPFVWGGQ